MSESKTMSEVLKDAIVQSGTPHLTLEQQTGVQRGSIARFVSGKRTLRLNTADVLAKHFGLELVPKERAKKGSK